MKSKITAAMWLAKIQSECKHFWVHDSMGYQKRCSRCGKVEQLKLTTQYSKTFKESWNIY